MTNPGHRETQRWEATGSHSVYQDQVDEPFSEVLYIKVMNQQANVRSQSPSYVAYTPLPAPPIPLPPAPNRIPRKPLPCTIREDGSEPSYGAGTTEEINEYSQKPQQQQLEAPLSSSSSSTVPPPFPEPKPAPSNFDQTHNYLVLPTDGCSIPVDDQCLPMHAHVLLRADAIEYAAPPCNCREDAFGATAALLRLWPWHYAARALKMHPSRADHVRWEVIKKRVNPDYYAKLRLCVSDSEHVWKLDRDVLDAVAAALRDKSRCNLNVGIPTVLRWERDDTERLDDEDRQRKKLKWGSNALTKAGSKVKNAVKSIVAD